MSNIENKILFITGGTGFVGSAFIQHWLAFSDERRAIVQTRFPENYAKHERITYVKSYAETSSDIDVVINLAGAPIADKRWSSERKGVLEESRIALTENLIQQIGSREHRPKVIISASAIGYYGVGENPVDEHSAVGEGYAASLCERWEKAVEPAQAFSRLVIMRLGVVLGDGGVLSKLKPVFSLGLGGPIASGNQGFSWIHLDDVIGAFDHAIAHHSMVGVYNLTSPQLSPQGDFAKALGKALSRPAFMLTPGFVLRLIFGEMAQELLIGGQYVKPARLSSEGYNFSYDNLESALHSVLQK